MYGMVNQSVEDRVGNHFGEDKWDLIRKKAGGKEEFFVSNEEYPDEKGLEAFVVGFLNGLGKWFLTPITGRQIGFRGIDSDHAIFAVDRRLNPALM